MIKRANNILGLAELLGRRFSLNRTESLCNFIKNNESVLISEFERVLSNAEEEIQYILTTDITSIDREVFRRITLNMKMFRVFVSKLERSL